MYLRHLKLLNFKNYEETELEFSEKINCFVGNNGSGKTNILDAIYYLSFTKSYFNSIDSQNIRHGEEQMAIHGSYVRSEKKTENLHCIVQAGQSKKFSFNKTEYQRLADHIGLFPLVMVSPYDRDLINDGSEVRRKYIDSVISQFDKAYLDHLLDYNKALAQRNILLKQFAEQRFFDSSMLEIWDEALIPHGKFIYEKRKSFLEDFMPLFYKYFEFVSGGNENVEIEYSSQLTNESLENLIKSNLDRDRGARYTTQGIHKDDLEFLISGFPIKKFGSQGQQKSFVVAIKLAQFEYTRKIKGFKPILLFDDIFDKLDSNRVHQIIHLVSENSFGQVFITDTQPERIQSVFNQITIEHRIFNVQNNCPVLIDL